MLVCCYIMTSCGDDDDDPNNVSAIVGKWQKYQRINDDGSISDGDPDEFWVYNADGTFQNIDGGDLCEEGTYSVSGNTLTITAHEVNYPEDSYIITGTFRIENGLMTYTYVYDDDPESDTLVFKKV